MKGMNIGGVLLPAVVIGLSGCMGMGDCVQGTSAPVQREITLAAFTGVVSEGAVDVTLTRGDVQHVVATGPAELLDLIETEVSKGVWHIDLKKCYTTHQSFHIDITVPAIEQAAVEGSGSITSTSTFDGDRLGLSIAGSGNITMQVNMKHAEVDIAGSGSVTLSGTSGELETSIAGSGDLHAVGLSAAIATASIAGSGTVEVTAVEKLNADITGSGDVRYKGRPEVKSNIVGSGSVSSLE